MDLDEGSLKLVDPENLTVLNTQPIHTIRVWGVGRDNGRFVHPNATTAIMLFILLLILLLPLCLSVYLSTFNSLLYIYTTLSSSVIFIYSLGLHIVYIYVVFPLSVCLLCCSHRLLFLCLYFLFLGFLFFVD